MTTLPRSLITTLAAAAATGTTAILLAGVVNPSARPSGLSFVVTALTVMGAATASRWITQGPRPSPFRRMVLQWAGIVAVATTGGGLAAAFDQHLAFDVGIELYGLSLTVALGTVGLAFLTGAPAPNRPWRHRGTEIAVCTGLTAVGLLSSTDALPLSLSLFTGATAALAVRERPRAVSLALGGATLLTIGFMFVSGTMGMHPTSPLMSIVAAILVSGVTQTTSHVLTTERARARANQASYNVIVTALAEGLIVLDGQRRTLQINPAACKLFGVTEDDAIGQPPGFGVVTLVDQHGNPLAQPAQPSVLAVAGHEVDDVVLGLRHADGHITWASISTRLLPGGHSPDAPAVVLTASDITLRLEAEKASQAETTQLRHRALHDSLTGLPNRTLLMDRLVHAHTNALRRGAGTGLIVIDLDGFKDVNDTLGHAAGDEVLVQVAVRLRTTLRGSDTAARLGGDEFVVLCEDLHPGMADLELARIADRIQALLNEPYVTSSGPADVGASLGWAMAQPGDDLNLDLVVAADEAMLADKRSRKRTGDDPLVPRHVVADPEELADETGLTVYIVDDDPAMRLLAGRILDSSGTRLRVVGEAADGATAIREIVAQQPDLVLCDVMMPTVSGPEVVVGVRETHPSQQFIFWSATTAPELERFQAELGVPYVLKDRIEELPAALLEAAQPIDACSTASASQGSPPFSRS